MENLICIDIDGTILPAGGSINQKVFEIIEGNDNKYLIVSGRPVHEIRNFGINIDCVGSNGGEVVKDGKVISVITLENEIISDLYKYLHENCGNVTVSTTEGRFLNEDINIENLASKMVLEFNGSSDLKMENYIVKEVKKNKGFIINIDSFLENKYHVTKLECATFEKMDEIVECLEKRDDIYIFSSVGGHIEIVPKNINKAAGIKKYVAEKSYKIFAIGDGNNDIEMFNMADVSFAMENGTEQLKQIATHMTSSVHNDGFIEAIDFIKENY